MKRYAWDSHRYYYTAKAGDYTARVHELPSGRWVWEVVDEFDYTILASCDSFERISEAKRDCEFHATALRISQFVKDADPYECIGYDVYEETLRNLRDDPEAVRSHLELFASEDGDQEAAALANLI